MGILNLHGLFENIFGKHSGGGSTLPEYRLLSSFDSSFTPFNGRAWDIATVRAAVDAWVRNAAKIQPRHIRRAGGRRETVSDGLERILQTRPNPYMTAYAFYYRVAVQFAVYNNTFILPVFDGGKLTAIYLINAQRVDLVENMGGMYARLVFATGNVCAVPYEHLAHLRRHYLGNDIALLAEAVEEERENEDSVAYEVSGGQAAANATDPVLHIARITPTMISILSYVSANIRRTTPLNYQSRVTEGALSALRKKTGAMIVMGDPAATITEPTGILKAAAILDSSDLTIEKINEKTLREIALNYGGANNVEGGGVLFLNKKDLISFGDVRGTNEKKAVYEIGFSENSTTTGTIKDGGLTVKSCIVDELPAISDTGTGYFGRIFVRVPPVLTHHLCRF